MPTFRRKPELIEAVRWFKHGDSPDVRKTSYMEIFKLLGTSGCSTTYPYWDWQAMGIVQTPSRFLVVVPGDWIITDAQGEKDVCKPDAFGATYDRVESESAERHSALPESSSDAFDRAPQEG
jgi:hypothetical protein